MGKERIGFIGQGYIGKNYADDFERRGYSVVRYALEEPYLGNRESIKECDIVFIAVPTPTTPAGFDDSIVRNVMSLVGDGKIAVIKSTMVPGTTELLQRSNRRIKILYSPEFLCEATAAHDAAHPFTNIVGLSIENKEHKEAGEKVMSVLPKAPQFLFCHATEAEYIKYTHNSLGYIKVVFVNMLYDMVERSGCRWEIIKKAMEADPMITNWYNDPVHKSGRGAGGHCFIKDFSALARHYEELVGDKEGEGVFQSFERKNKKLLQQSNKDIDLLEGVYGKLEGV
ncbi:MAG TPA: hypothetical protein VJH21_00530 [Candidatus Paceibacterota bacterium]